MAGWQGEAGRQAALGVSCAPSTPRPTTATAATAVATGGAHPHRWCPLPPTAPTTSGAELVGDIGGACGRERTMITFHFPLLHSTAAVARPRPEEVPVTSTVFLVSNSFGCAVEWCRSGEIPGQGACWSPHRPTGRLCPATRTRASNRPSSDSVAWGVRPELRATRAGVGPRRRTSLGEEPLAASLDLEPRGTVTREEWALAAEWTRTGAGAWSVARDIFAAGVRDTECHVSAGASVAALREPH